MSAPSVHPMRVEDAAAVLEMSRALATSLGDPPPNLAAHDLIRDGIGAERWFDCLVAEIAGAPVGHALVCRGFEAHTGKRRLWLGDLYVRPEARRAGVGRALMAAIAWLAIEHGCDAVYWELWRPNAAGRAFYETLAAEECGELAIMRIDGRTLAILASR